MIHEGIPKITDFGAGKQMGVKTKHKNGVMGAICYLDPKRCDNEKFNDDYKLEKPSDIYSLGVIFWQITSGKQPFEDVKRNLDTKGLWNLFSEILNGKREEAIEGTPKEFIQLYEACWHSVPAIRPTISEVIETIEPILHNNMVEIILKLMSQTL